MLDSELPAAAAPTGRAVAFSIRMDPAAFLFSACAVFYLGMSLAALASQQFLYADGAFFAFTAVLKDPWTLFWSDYASRAGAAFVSVAPAYAVRHLFGAGLDATVFTYQLTWIAYPAAMAALTAALTPRPSRAAVMTVVLAVSMGLVVSAFGFPSEAIIGICTLWPLLTGLRFPKAGVLRFSLLAALSAILVFSHEGLVLASPVVLLAAALGWKHADGRAKGWVTASAAVFLALLLVALFVARAHVPANPLVRTALAGNGLTAFSKGLLIMLSAPFVDCALAAFLWALTALVDDRRVKAALLIGAVLFIVATQPLAQQKFYSGFNYLIRSWIILAAPFAGLALLHSASAGRRAPGWFTVGFIATLMLAQAAHEAAFIGAWDRYRTHFLTELDQPGPPVVSLEAVEAGLRRNGDGAVDSFSWPWLAGYQSVTWRPLHPPYRRRIAVSANGLMAPFLCRDADALRADRPVEVSLAAYEALIADDCRKNPPSQAAAKQ